MRANLVVSGIPFRAKSTVLAVAALAVSGCVSTSVSDELPRGAEAYDVARETLETRPVEYLIGPYDSLEIQTFMEPDLSFAAVPVDRTGRFSFPFIGQVKASGITTYELESEIEERLNERYTRNAQVTVFVKTAAADIFSVEGDVNKPGAFEYAGPTSLLQAIARAESPTRTAKLSEIVVFRVVDGQRYGAVFNLNDIREGSADDPQILPGDTIFVGYSAIKTVWREFLQLSPVINAFTRF